MANLTDRLLSEDFEEALKETLELKGYDVGGAYLSADTRKASRLEHFATAISQLHDRLRTAKTEGAAEAYEDIKAQAEDLRKEGGIRAELLRLLTEECVSRAAAIRKGLEAKEGK